MACITKTLDTKGYCVFCLRKVDPGRLAGGPLSKKVKKKARAEPQPEMEKFSKLIGRFLKGNLSSDEEEKRTLEGECDKEEEDFLNKQFKRDTFVNLGTACQDCYYVVGKFCEIYCIWAKVELELTCQVQKLKDIVSQSGKVSSRVRSFTNEFSKGGKDEKEKLKEVEMVRKEFLNKCNQKFKGSQPQIRLKRKGSPSRKKVDSLPVIATIVKEEPQDFPSSPVPEIDLADEDDHFAQFEAHAEVEIDYNYSPGEGARADDRKPTLPSPSKMGRKVTDAENGHNSEDESDGIPMDVDDEPPNSPGLPEDQHNSDDESDNNLQDNKLVQKQDASTQMSPERNPPVERSLRITITEDKSDNGTQNAKKPSPNTCSVCSRVLQNVTQLTYHMYTHVNPRSWPFYCKYCNRRFYRVTDFKLHRASAGHVKSKRQHKMDKKATPTPSMRTRGSIAVPSTSAAIANGTSPTNSGSTEPASITGKNVKVVRIIYNRPKENSAGSNGETPSDETVTLSVTDTNQIPKAKDQEAGNDKAKEVEVIDVVTLD